MSQGPAIHAIVVCYHPDVAAVGRMASALAGAGARVVLVDNTPGPSPLQGREPPGAELLALGRNTGIAHAQNVGIRHALSAGTDIVVFFDQDSQLEPGFLRALVAPLVPGRPGVTGPRLLDEASGAELPAQRLSPRGLPRPSYCGDRTAPLDVDVIIASGSAATREVFALAGLMDEALFIDSVDTEWCLRCRAHGVPVQVVPAAVMRHRIGSAAVRIGRSTVLLHSPTRCYYQFRNSVLLFKRAHVPFLFALREALAIAWSRVLLLSVVQQRTAYIRACLSGLYDGLRGVTGERPASPGSPSAPSTPPASG